MSEINKVTVEVEGDAPEVNGQKYTSLTFRKMKAKDLVAGDLVKGDARRSMAIFASMSGVPIQVIEELDMDDFGRVGEAVSVLMGKSIAAAAAEAEAAQ